QTPIEVLAELQAAEPGIPPTGFIFHMSRCGSTLISQMLAALPQNVVVSEAGPVDAVLRARFQAPDLPEREQIGWLQGIVSALGRRRTGEESHFFVKLDAWHTLDLPLIQRAFPDVPWLFLYRNPVEVMVSHARQPGSQLVPGMLPP